MMPILMDPGRGIEGAAQEDDWRAYMDIDSFVGNMIEAGMRDVDLLLDLHPLLLQFLLP